MAQSHLLNKVESALAEYLHGLFPDATIYEGKNDEEKTLPCVICAATNAGEDYPVGSGNKWVEASVEIHTAAPKDADGVSALDDSNTLAADIVGAIHDDNIRALLTAAVDDFTAMGVIFEGNTFSAQDDAWVESVALKVYCCPS